jgi:Domain of unknown function (DUF4286)
MDESPARESNQEREWTSHRGRDSMIIYCVTITIDASIEPEWVDWMKRIHVPDVVRTGFFSECRIYKVIDSEVAGPSYVMQYHCLSLEEYHLYRDNFAVALQKEHSDKFAGRFRGARQLLEEVDRATGAGDG